MNEDIYQTPASSLQNRSTEAVSITLIQLLFSFEGRIGRLKYWLGTLGIVAVYLAFVFTLSFIGIDESTFGVLFLVLYIPFLWASFAIQAKRWHDRDKSGLWILISIIPVIGPLWALIENGFLPGTEGINSYGPASI